MPFIDVSGDPDPQAAARFWMDAERARPIDLTKGPLFAFALFRTRPDQFLWYARYHHIIMDGFSMSLVARRVADVYTLLVQEGTFSECPFGSLALLLEDDATYRSSDQFVSDRQYWLECLADRTEQSTTLSRQTSR